MRTLTLLGSLALLGVSPAVATAGSADLPGARGTTGRGAALVIEAGSVAHRQLVAVGRDVEVAGQALSDAVALNGAVTVSGRVEGDVLALGGDVRLASTARVGGDVFAMGGTVSAAPGAVIGGRSLSYPDASAAWLTLLEGPALGLSAGSPLVVGGKVALLAAWLALAIAFFAVSGRQVLSTSRGVTEEPLRSFATGVVGVLAILLTALLFSAFAAALVGVPLLVLAVLLALVLKLWGMIAVFHALGDWLGRRFLHRPPAPSTPPPSASSSSARSNSSPISGSGRGPPPPSSASAPPWRPSSGAASPGSSRRRREWITRLCPGPSSGRPRCPPGDHDETVDRACRAGGERLRRGDRVLHGKARLPAG